ncbi:MAG TPA: YraN family protein [Burkholderiales bacterium]|nr:YraN family protein [Burkholderiales bacterium]
MTTRTVGRTGEKIALAYLRRKGYKILETGFRFLRGEIDIIARDGATLVFIEVKMRTGLRFGRPEESVTAAKQQQIRKVAEGYLLKHRLVDTACRFDVVAISPDERGGHAVEHFEDAF